LSARILNGNAIRDQIYGELHADIAALSAASIRPGLAAVLVGENPASKLYVNSKIAACEKLGLASFLLTPPATITTGDLLALIDQLNRRDDVDGILVQMPLPPQIDSKKILDAVSPEKDVDGFHPINVGLLASGRPALVPCTPLGCMRLIAKSGVSLRGAHAVVVGRSNIVGKPVAQLLLAEDATVTMAHSRTRDLPSVCRSADVLVAAVGKPEMVRGDWVKEGAVVIDVGINRVAIDGASDGKTRLVGDVCFDEAKERARAITPVPKGVGPMTIAYLLSNTLRAAERRLSG
jgi:methylenetetrahydrofolate dehydrogenase (NADP+) / methenyltetrahydrofolate cyclohydrolase